MTDIIYFKKSEDGIEVECACLLYTSKELLEQIGIEFDIITSDVDETTLITQPDEYVKYLSRIKAQAVWDMVKDDDDYRNEDVVRCV